MVEDKAWEVIQPRVKAEAEFNEILSDFGDPLEILREAISNSIDADASRVRISFDVEEPEGVKRLVIRISDNGTGMTKEVLAQDFWGLGYSKARERKKTGDAKDLIGEKGHGTKIYLRSERVLVRTIGPEGAYESECLAPRSALAGGKMHEPRIRSIQRFREGTGTDVEIVGYNDNERSRFVQGIVRDYLLWFTKLGSIEQQFGHKKHDAFKVFLKCVGAAEFEEVPFGHTFPAEDSNIEALFDEKGPVAADSYVKYFTGRECRLKNHPEVTFDYFISVEGDEIKRRYNPMLRKQRRSDAGYYRVSDRYGIWLCKDYIPVVRVLEWISGFGSGSNAYVLLHGFVNCQSLKLTANRGAVANTDPQILAELQERVKEIIADIDAKLANDGLYTLRTWQAEETTLQQEKAEYSRRVKQLKTRKTAELDGQLLYEPLNESELFGLLMTVYSRRPDLFPFQPIDYNTTRGIDIIARDKVKGALGDSEYWYVELKYVFRQDFNHAFQYLRWIVCWDFDKGVNQDIEFVGVEETDIRRLQVGTDDSNHPLYFLDNKKKPGKIQIIRLKEYLKKKLNLEFELRPEQ